MSIKEKIIVVDMRKFGDMLAKGVKAIIIWSCIFILGAIWGVAQVHPELSDMVEERVIRDVNYLLTDAGYKVFFRTEDSTLRLTVPHRGRKRPSDAMNIKLTRYDKSNRP